MTERERDCSRNPPDGEAVNVKLTKLGVMVPVSASMLQAAEPMRAMMRQFALEMLNPPSNEERERRKAAARAEAAPVQQSIRHRHNQLVAAADSRLVADLLNLHGPTFSSDTDRYPHCDGCDPGSYAEDSPGWPCTTYERIAEDLGQTRWEPKR